MDPSAFLSVDDVAHELTLGATTVRRHLDSGLLPSVRVQRRRLVPREAIEELQRHAMEGFDAEKVSRRLRGTASRKRPPASPASSAGVG
jgi:excisionase family DNA binding protein